MSEKPILRLLDFQPISHEGEHYWYLRDPLKLSEHQLVMPHALAHLLAFCDGTRTLNQIHLDFCQTVGFELPIEVVENAIQQLDEALLLDNKAAQLAIKTLKTRYRQQPYRPPALAELSYPDSPEALGQLLNGYGRGDDLASWQPWRGRGLISPHIDYQRGGPVYSKVWQRAKTAVLEADLVIIFGTDHNGGPGTFTLTHVPYATPYGVLPARNDIVDKVADAIGPENAFAEELHHRQEHSIELTAVWLHHIYHEAGAEAKPMLPVLVGSFQHFVQNGVHPANDPILQTALEVLKGATATLKVLAVASVDFAHVGPAFGDDYLMTPERRSQLQQTDDFLLQAIIRGDAASFYNQIAATENSNKVCGFSPIYLMLNYLGTTEGVQVAYEHCPADEADESLVSIAGVLLE